MLLRKWPVLLCIAPPPQWEHRGQPVWPPPDRGHVLSAGPPDEISVPPTHSGFQPAPLLAEHFPTRDFLNPEYNFILLNDVWNTFFINRYIGIWKKYLWLND